MTRTAKNDFQLSPFSACNQLPPPVASVSCGRRPRKEGLVDRSSGLSPTLGMSVFDPASQRQIVDTADVAPNIQTYILVRRRPGCVIPMTADKGRQ